MTLFLSWIFAQSAKFYDWFGNSYNALRNAAANAWNWAVSQAISAYNNAVSYAYDIALQAFHAAQSFVLSQYQLALDWIDRAWIFIQNVRDDAVIMFNNAVTVARSYALEVYNALRSEFYSAIQTAQNLFGIVFNAVTNFINEHFGWVYSLRDIVLDLLSFLSRDTINDILQTIQNIKDKLLLFLDNPVEFIFDILWERFVSFFCFVMAHALGTTKYELPNSPPWKRE